MAIDRLQIKRVSLCLIFLLPCLLVGCISSEPFPGGVAIEQPSVPPVIRLPKVGQEWVYQVRNVFNQELVDIVTERVVEVSPQIKIARSGQKSGPLPDEIQSPWGFIVQDPHWKPPQKFEQALPLWPEQSNDRWSGFYRTRYEVLGYPDASYYWGLNINALGWERMTVPAGQFITFRYINEAPYFQSNDVFRWASYRQEEVWLAPEIGRWAIRRGYGRYITAGVFWANAYWEDYLEWTLISWR